MYENIKKFMEELADKHTDKFLYALEKPEWFCWFQGRIRYQFGYDTDQNLIDSAIFKIAGVKNA